MDCDKDNDDLHGDPVASPHPQTCGAQFNFRQRRLVEFVEFVLVLGAPFCRSRG